jgi:dolichol-phosphate mannosyltransferase
VTGSAQRPRVVAFLPVYNQAEQIGLLLETFRPILAEKIVDELIAVDDGSTDATPELLRSFGMCTVLSHPSNQGIGAAIRDAYDHALSRGYDVFVIMAGNGKDEPAQIPTVLAPILAGDADYVQGSRYLSGGYSEGVPGHRKLAMRMFTSIFSLFLMSRLTDCTNGFRAYRVDLLRDPRIQWRQPWLGDGYELEYYMHYKAISLGYRFCEVPVSKIYRRASDGSYSKIRGRDWITALKPLFLLRTGLRR